ncbi:MAG: class I SAM-dependent methyltransferase [Acidobacteriota bacterium]
MNRAHRWYCRSAHWTSTLDGLIPWAVGGVDLGDHILELGSGAGLVTPRLSRVAKRTTAVDIDRAAIAETRGAPGITLVCADAAALPFVTGTFSAVVACAMLHHVPTRVLQQRLFRDAFRTLQRGGVFVAVDVHFTLAMRLFHLGDRCAPLTPDAVCGQLTAAGFVDVVAETQGRYFRVCARSL